MGGGSPYYKLLFEDFVVDSDKTWRDEHVYQVIFSRLTQNFELRVFECGNFVATFSGLNESSVPKVLYEGDIFGYVKPIPITHSMTKIDKSENFSF